MDATALRRLIARSQGRLLCSLIVTLGTLAQTPPAWSITFGQVDDFQDATTQGWGTPLVNPNPPITVLDVGPWGIGDDSLQITSTGETGPGSRLVAINEAQWQGDYLSEGVGSIIADVNNTGPTPLNLRFAFDGAGGWFVTTVAEPLSVGSGWQRIIFPIGAADLTAVEGGTNVMATLGDVTIVRVLSAANPGIRGDTIDAELLIDNIAAPEPSEYVLLVTGLAGLWTLAKWRARSRRIEPKRPRGGRAIA